MALDPKRLHEDAKHLQKARLPTIAGRETTGTTRAIRAALPVIYQLREEGVSWSAIASALADQGVVQGRDRIALTTHRLTALVSQIEDQTRNKARKDAGRVRTDAVERKSDPVRKLTLSADLVTRPEPTARPATSTEDELRRAAFENLKHVLKKE